MYLFFVYFVDVSCILYLFNYLYCLKIITKKEYFVCFCFFNLIRGPIFDIVQNR